MTAFLDDLARTMAKPMPRSRAVRVLGTALVGIAVPGIATTKARATSSFHTCEKDGGLLCKCPNRDLFYQICCIPKEDFECKCKAPPNGYAQCRKVCKVKCGSICCKQGETCADPDIEYCCPIRTRPCTGGGTVNCCGSSEHCCDGICCRRDTRCKPGPGGAKGTCAPCPQKSKKCGNTCCIKGEPCCSGKCCSKSQKCCFENHCCKKIDTCCGETCCNDKQKCCGDHCCAKDKECCDKGCCPKNMPCTQSGSSGKVVCCPAARVIRTGSAAICCPAGDRVVNGQCCPPNSNSCDTCDPPCRPNQFCREGACVGIP